MASNGVFRVNIFLFLLLASSHGVRHGYGSRANMRNVAPYGTCNQSSIYTIYPSPDGNDCTAAMNRNVRTTYTRGNCIHTAHEYPNTTGPFWKVTLDKEYNIHGISVYGRTDGYNNLLRMTHVQVLIDDKKVYRFHETETPSNPTEISEGLPLSGRTVTLSRKNESDSFLNLCEVQIWVCKKGKHGTNCSDDCGHCADDQVCNSINGSCPSGCQQGWKEPLCTECKEGKHGTNCRDDCGHCADDQACNSINGSCPSGCQQGWKEPLCTECKEGKHGRNCMDDCGHCADDQACNSINGSCPSGCQQGWKEPLCTECKEGKHGTNCRDDCGHCADDQACNSITGSCPSGCQQGWKESLCTECEKGKHGTNCMEDCGHCADDQACNRINGNCPSGCQQGWKEPLCTAECEEGKHGTNCMDDCGHCADDQACNSITGSCVSGCQLGWKEPLCTVCEEGKHGRNCMDDCGHCADGPACNKINGSCPSGCQQGWKKPLCTECVEGKHGKNCMDNCGHCADNQTCNSINGSCPSGCQQGWKEPLCSEVADSASSEGPPLASFISLGLVCILLLALIVVATIVIRTKRYKRWFRRDEDLPTEPHVSDAVALDDRLGTGNANQNGTGLAEGSLPTVMVHPQTSQHPPTTTHRDGQPSTSAAATVGADSSAEHIYVNTRGKMPPTKVPWKKKSSTKSDLKAEGTYKNVTRKKCGSELAKEEEEEEEEEEEDEDVYTHEDLYAMYCEVKRPRALLDAFQTRLLQCLAFPEQLSVQFQKFPRGMQYPAEVCDQPANASKNRFKKLGAYDKNRVVLKRSICNKDSTDYINASFIKGVHSNKDYIAAQGPRPNTVEDMWWMVWQEHVTQIVMVTNLVEHEKVKCAEYWPPLGETVTYGHVKVTSEGVEEKTDFLIRKFAIRVEGSGSPRCVHQYHYLAWPDHGVPVATSLVYFWRYVRARATAQSPPLVHCSAGVGRTGTYIALDIACERKSRGLDVNVSSIVTELREQRTLMVQTEAQYKFLHEVILEEHTSRGTMLTLEQLDTGFPRAIPVHGSCPTIDQQFQILQQLKSWAKQDTSAAEQEENKSKNRQAAILPGANHMVYLDGYVKGRNQYINAVFVSSLMVRKGFLLTQLPLPDTVEDLWRLVHGRDVRIIVSLGAYDNTKVKNYARYWPKVLNQKLQAGGYTVWLDKVSSVSDTICLYRLHIDAKEQRTVTVLHYTDWTQDLPNSTTDLMELVSLLRTEVEKVTSPVIVQCLDGARQSGLFSVLCDVISRMEEDEKVDVFATVRSLHQIRPQAVNTEVQYRYCFHVAQEYRESQKVYINA